MLQPPPASIPSPSGAAGYISNNNSKPSKPVKINNHFIAPKKKGLENMVRDHSKVTMEVFERNLAKRKGLLPSGVPKGQKNFMVENLVPKRHYKITQGGKDIVLDQY